MIPQTGHSLGAVAAGAVVPVLARRAGRPGMLGGIAVFAVGTVALQIWSASTLDVAAAVVFAAAACPR